MELGVFEDLPPPAPRQGVAGLRHFPAIRLLVGRRHGHGRLHVVRADHAATEYERGEPGQAGDSSPHGRVRADALTTRTGVPLVSESDGATMT